MSKEIYYLRGRGEEHEELISALRHHGFVPRVMRTIDEVLARFLREPPPRAVFVDASISDAETAERVVELQSAEELFEIPTVFIGRQANERSRVLRQRYRLFIPVEFPFRIDALLQQFEQVGKAMLPKSELPRLREKPDPANLGGSFGGSVFALAADHYVFDDSLLIPKNPTAQLMKETLDYLSSRNAWLGAHARRTAFVASAIGQRLDEEDSPLVRISGLFLNWALAESEKRLKFDLLEEGNHPQGRVLADAFRVSADSVMSVFKDQQAASTIHAVADIIYGHFGGTLRQRRHAECVLASELSDRACWQSGRWNKAVVPRVIRQLRTSSMFEVKDAAFAMGRVLGEAVHLFGTPVSLEPPKTAKERLELEEQVSLARSESAKFRLQDTQRVRFLDLKPGMKLAEPLVTNDGRLILEVDTLLDFDILMRVLQLSAARSLPSDIRIAKSASFAKNARTGQS
jgi:hypothetical protein